MVGAKEQKTALDLEVYDGEDRIVFSNELKLRLEADKSKTAFNAKSRFFPEMSSSIGGFEGGEVIVVSAYTGHGKTTFCQSLTRDFCEQGHIPLWFSYEVQPMQFLNKFGKSLPIFTMPAKVVDKSTFWLEERCHEAIVKYNASIVFIDHLHFLVDMIHRNASLEIGAIVRSVKLLALKYNLIIFLIAHTTKPSGDAKELELGAVRDSSFIEQEADTVLYLWRSKKEQDIGTLKIAKDRKNGTFDKKITIIKSMGLFKEASHERV